jgi:hypothetical protein
MLSQQWFEIGELPAMALLPYRPCVKVKLSNATQNINLICKILSTRLSIYPLITKVHASQATFLDTGRTSTNPNLPAELPT